MDRRAELGALSIHLANHKKSLGVVASLSIIASLAEAAILLCISGVALSFSKSMPLVDLGPLGEVELGETTLLAAGFVATRLAFGLLASRSGSRLLLERTAAVRSRLVKGFHESSWRLKSSENAGDLQESINLQTQKAAELVGAATTLTTQLTALVSLLSISVALNPLATGAVAMLLFIFGVLMRPLRKMIRRQSVRSLRASVEYGLAVAESADVALEIESFGVSGKVVSALNNRNEAWRSATYSLYFLKGASSLVYTTLAFVAVLTALLVAGNVGSNGASTSTSAVMLMMLRCLSFGQVIQASSASISSAAPAVTILEDKMRGYSDSLRRERTLVHQSVSPPFSLVAASYAYPVRSAVLVRIDLTIAAGDRLAIVGASGSGKSTLAQLLAGVRVPTSGDYLVAGTSTARIDRSELAQVIAYVPQQPRLIRGSVLENVVFYRDYVDRSSALAALTAAGLTEELSTWPDGADFRLDGESRLSGGQSQRVAVARALAGGPSLLVCDEPTSSLDPQSEASMLESFANLPSNMALVIVTHRAAALRFCNRFVLVVDGSTLELDAAQASEFLSDR